MSGSSTSGAGDGLHVSAETSGQDALGGPARAPEDGDVSAETPQHAPAGAPEPRRATLAEALLELARRSLDRARPSRAARSATPATSSDRESHHRGADAPSRYSVALPRSTMSTLALLVEVAPLACTTSAAGVNEGR